MYAGTDYIRILLALLIVLGLLALLNYCVRRYGHLLGLPQLPSSKGQRRLQIIEQLPLDSRTRAVLIRRDTVEHLVLINQNTLTVVETDISPVTESQ